MVNKVNHKRSAVAGKIPSTTDLELGQLAINTTDGKLFLKKSDGGTESIVDVGKDSETAVKLKTARTINGVSFDGSANITVADSTKLPLTGGTLTGDLQVTGTISGNGSGLTTLNASNLSSGTIPGDRGVTAGSTTSSFVEYNGTTATAGQFDGGTTTPTGTTRLNYGGYFYPTFLNLAGSADTATAATHYFVETGSDGFVRPKTLANVRNEIAAIVAGNSSIGPLRYSGTTKAAGTLDGGTVDPTSTTRLNYDGYFYATRFYGDSSQLSVATTSANGVMSAADKTKLDGITGTGGGATDGMFYENGQSITSNFTVGPSKNAGTFGPITIANGVSVTISDGCTWSVV